MRGVSMQNLVREYEYNAALLFQRIKKLDKALKQDGNLGNQERDTLMMRRNLLMTERIELLRDIRDMQRYGTGGTH